MMELLLGAGADVDAVDNGGMTPFHLASRSDRRAAAAWLLASGAALNALDSHGWAALHHASACGGLEVVQLLVISGAPVDAVEVSGRTAIRMACEVGSLGVVQYLLLSGADPCIQDSHGRSGLYMASENGHAGVVRLLLSEGVTPGHVNATTVELWTPLHTACMKGHDRVVGMLLLAGANVAAKDSRGFTPLHEAALHGHVCVLQQLLAAGADPRAAIPGRPTALHCAAKMGHQQALQTLLAALVTEPGDSPLDVAVGGFTPLYMAAVGGHTRCVELLVGAGADPDKLYDPEEGAAAGNILAGASSLHLAVVTWQTALVPLLATPANMRCAWRGSTPLHLALRPGRPPSMAQDLVAAGSPVGVVDADGMTAMSLAAGSKNVLFERLLPDMVRGECGRIKQLLQGVVAQQQPQKLAPDAVLAAVTDALYALLEGSADSPTSRNPDIVVACIQVVLEVLGGAAGSSLMQQVLGKCMAADAARSAEGEGGRCSMQLVAALSKGCSAALEPLMQQRWALTNRLQQLVTAACEKPPSRQPRGRGRQAAGAAAGGAEGPQQAGTDLPLSAQAMAAAQAGDWQQLVQLWEQLQGQQQALGQRLLCDVQEQLSKGLLVGEDGLCGALMQAWVAAQQEVAGRKQRERASAVVGAVQAAGQQTAVAVGDGRRGQVDRFTG
jgi:ankyrin repeat protein